MSKAPALAFAMEGWSPDVTAGQRPSWILRKITPSRPPITSARPSGRRTIPPEISSEPTEVIASLHPPPPGPVEIATSMALTQLADENMALRLELEEMQATVGRLRREILEASEPELVKLALAIGERVVGRELATDPSLVVTWARDAVEALGAEGGVVIAVARDIARHVSAEAWGALDAPHREITDGQLPAGTLEVRGAEGIVTTGLSPRLAAVAQALGVPEDP